MSKVTIYVRVAKYEKTYRYGYKVAATAVKASNQPLSIQRGIQSEYLSTVAFALVLDVPDEAFKQAEKVLAEIEIPLDKVQLAVEVAAPTKPEEGAKQ